MSAADTSAPSPSQGTFAQLQARLISMFNGFSDQDTPRTVVIVPSLTMDREVLANISGAHHYEERMLCYLMLLRLPRTQIIYVTSHTIPEPIIYYYLHLLP